MEEGHRSVFCLVQIMEPFIIYYLFPKKKKLHTIILKTEFQVASPSCSDADGNTLTYTLVSGNTDSKFAISSSSGQITLANSKRNK